MIIRNFYYSYLKDEKSKFIEGSIEAVIKEDDVEKLIKLASEPNFNPKGQINFEVGWNICSVEVKNITKDIITNSVFISYMQTMAFYGAVKCFKYALMDGSFDEENLNLFAIAGGDKNIIRLLEQKEVSFNDCFKTSVKFNRNDISDWLLMNYKCEILTLSETVEFFNIYAFYFVLKNIVQEPFFRMAEVGRSLPTKILFSVVNKAKFTINNALGEAVCAGNVNIIKFLIDKCKADINQKYVKNQYTFKEWSLIELAVNNNYPEVVKLLCERKANIDYKTDGRETLLNRAVFENKTEAVKVLVNYYRHINLHDQCGNTPLHNAVENNNLEIVKCLVEKGADINKLTLNMHWNENECRETALHFAIYNKNIEIVKYLVEHGASVNSKEGVDNFLKCALKTKNEEIINYLKSKGAE